MKIKFILFIIAFISVTNAFAQKRAVENAIQDIALVPSKSAKAIDDQKACDVINKSTSRIVTVRIEESVLINNFLQKNIIAIEKIAPNEQKFVGYAGCDANVLYEKCTGYKIAVAYYEDDAPSMQNKVVRTVAATDGQGITVK